MKKPSLKKLTKKEKAEIKKDAEKEFDFDKAFKKGVFLNLDEDIIEYFKDLAVENGRGYQSLIRDALKYFKDKKMKPQTTWEGAS